MGYFSIWHWLIVLLVVILVFGTKKLRNIGQDLGSAVKGFKQGMQEGTKSGTEDEKTITDQTDDHHSEGQTIEGEARKA